MAVYSWKSRVSVKRDLGITYNEDGRERKFAEVYHSREFNGALLPTESEGLDSPWIVRFIDPNELKGDSRLFVTEDNKTGIILPITLDEAEDISTFLFCWKCFAPVADEWMIENEIIYLEGTVFNYFEHCKYYLYDKDQMIKTTGKDITINEWLDENFHSLAVEQGFRQFVELEKEDKEEEDLSLGLQA